MNKKIKKALLYLGFIGVLIAAVVMIVSSMQPEDPTILDVIDMFEDWVAKLVAIIGKTYPYYNAVLTAYAGAEATLMADVTATSMNKVRFNDTPQNAGSGGTYEGEDYMTHFTRTDGESSTPLTTKINRLREIQDQYKRTMADWLKEVGRVFLPEGD